MIVDTDGVSLADESMQGDPVMLAIREKNEWHPANNEHLTFIVEIFE